MAKSSLSVSEPVFVKIRTPNKDILKKCPECECVWELHLQTKTILTYPDFHMGLQNKSKMKHYGHQLQ